MNTKSLKNTLNYSYRWELKIGEIFESCSDKIKHGSTDDLIGPSISGDDLL